METNIEKLDWNINRTIQSKDRDGRKTIDDVFDENTLKNIQQMFSRGIISTLENIIATQPYHIEMEKNMLGYLKMASHTLNTYKCGIKYNQ